MLILAVIIVAVLSVLTIRHLATPRLTTDDIKAMQSGGNNCFDKLSNKKTQYPKYYKYVENGMTIKEDIYMVPFLITSSGPNCTEVIGVFYEKNMLPSECKNLGGSPFLPDEVGEGWAEETGSKYLCFVVPNL